MGLLVFVRTLAALLATVGASASLSSNSRRNKEPDLTSHKSLSGPAPATDVIHTGAQNVSDTLEENNSLVEDNNNEARILELFNIPTRVSEKVEAASDEIGTLDKKLIDFSKASKGPQIVDANSIKYVHRTQLTDGIVADPALSTMLSTQWLTAEVHPGHTFTYMGLEQQLNPEGLANPSLKLRWWLNYIDNYRGLGGASTSHATFGNEELLNFLETKIPQQQHQWETMLTLYQYDGTLDLWRESVAMLFEVSRRYPNLRSFAVSMQVSMSSIPAYAKPMHHLWLNTKVSPIDLFDILRLGDEPNQIRESNAVFIAWLRYVAFHWTHVFPADKKFFHYESFNSLLSSKISEIHMTNILQSDSLNQVIEFDHQKILYALWKRKLWLDKLVDPQAVFNELELSGKIRLDSFYFVQGMDYIAHYRQRKPFTDRQLFDLLSPANSISEIARLFVKLERVQGMEYHARAMLDYISELMAKMLPPGGISPEDHWRQLFSGAIDPAANPDLFLYWYRCASKYNEYVKKKSPELAFSDVSMFLKTMVPNRWAKLMLVINEDPEVSQLKASLLQQETSSMNLSSKTSSTSSRYSRSSSELSVGN